jgi:hypothetical protein
MHTPDLLVAGGSFLSHVALVVLASLMITPLTQSSSLVEQRHVPERVFSLASSSRPASDGTTNTERAGGMCMFIVWQFGSFRSCHCLFGPLPRHIKLGFTTAVLKVKSSITAAILHDHKDTTAVSL